MKPTILSAFFALTAFPALACESFTVGDLTIDHAWSRATIGADRPGVFYVEITNAGASDDALIGIATPAAGMPMLHETTVTDGCLLYTSRQGSRPGRATHWQSQS